MQQISVQGADQVIRELRVFDRDALSILYKEIRKSMEAMRDDARARTPVEVLFGHRQDGTMSKGWGSWTEKKSGRNLGWSSTLVKSGLKTKASIRKSRGLGGLQEARGIVENTTAQGAIFSLAGSRNPNNSSFTREVLLKHGRGPYPRMLGPAWTKNIEKARADVRDALLRAADKVGR